MGLVLRCMLIDDIKRQLAIIILERLSTYATNIHGCISIQTPVCRRRYGIYIVKPSIYTHPTYRYIAFIMSKRKNGTSQVALSVDHLRREYRTGNIVVIENHSKATHYPSLHKRINSPYRR